MGQSLAAVSYICVRPLHTASSPVPTCRASALRSKNGAHAAAGFRGASNKNSPPKLVKPATNRLGTKGPDEAVAGGESGEGCGRRRACPLAAPPPPAASAPPSPPVFPAAPPASATALSSAYRSSSPGSSANSPPLFCKKSHVIIISIFPVMCSCLEEEKINKKIQFWGFNFWQGSTISRILPQRSGSRSMRFFV